jgi:hypothetical protein
MSLLAIDPGTAMSAWVHLDDAGAIIGHDIWPNEQLVDCLRALPRQAPLTVVIEKVEHMGQLVGGEVFETVYWAGRFAEAAHPLRVGRLGRRAVKLALCGSTRTNDSDIRAALIKRFGGDTAIGTKFNPGPLYGIVYDKWAALGVAVTWAELQEKGEAA